MSKNSFLKEAMYENHPQYQQAISRNEALYQRKNDLRSPFSRDYNRIIFSLAYRRLKHKFFLQLKMIMFVQEVSM